MAITSQGIVWTSLWFTFWFLASYLYHGLGITLGYHRLLTHRSLKVPQWLMYFIVSGGYLSLMGSPVVWVGVHRLHHQKSDVAGDPHSPRTHGFKHALYEWMYDMRSVQSDAELQAQVPELMKDPILRAAGCDHGAYQARLCLFMCVAFRVVLLALFGWVAVVANLAAMFCTFWSTQLVNSVCHLDGVGYRTFETREASRNVWWVGILALGEGWHNNHHAIPKSARHGLDWWEFDVTWNTIWLLEKVGLATNVIRPPTERKSRLVVDTASIQSLVPTAEPEPVLDNA